MSEKRFLVTARKYRPQRFDELVAQEHVTGTLKNAVRLDRLAHAYLFTGPRGVGKTTAARILAKAINCTSPADERRDGSEPCRTCESCRSFEEGRNLNIIEIDAASNNKVDDVRDLRETVRIPPQGNRRKVYIVDEVHMLTTQAFNALLKTLEEPPPHVLFIFATTEPHKVLPTIQSRCQRFDFRRIPVPDIVERLRSICAEESIEADEGALMLIARRGDGALRDALSVFDQAVSLCGDRLTRTELVEALGVVDEDLFFRVTDCIASADTAGMLDVVDRIMRSGYDLQEFLDGLAEHVRNLLVALTMSDSGLIEAAQATRARYERDADSFDEPTLLRLLSIVDQAMDRVRASRQPRLRLEFALLKMATLPSSVDLRTVLAELGGEPAPARPTPRTRPAKAVTLQPEAGGGGGSKEAVANAVTTDESVPTEPPDDSPAEAIDRDDSPTLADQAPEPKRQAPASESKRPDPAPQHPAGPGTTGEPGAPDVPEPALADDAAEPPAPPPGPTLFDAGGSGPGGAPALFGRPALEVTIPVPDATVAAPETVVEDEPSAVESPDWWAGYIDRVKDQRIHVGALLHHATARTTDDGTLRIEVPDDFHVRVLREEQDALQQALETDAEPLAESVRIVRGEAADRSDPEDAGETDPRELIRELCEEYPALQALMERFGGEIVW